MDFGEFIKSERLKAGYSLRKFCETIEFDPSNWSKIERGRMPAPADREMLEKIAKVLVLEKGSDDYYDFFNKAYIAKGIIPKEVYSDEEMLNALPVFFRTAQGKKPSKEELKNLIEVLKKR
jgi:transcriptional regulator with XRE-family HTH domain